MNLYQKLLCTVSCLMLSACAPISQIYYSPISGGEVSSFSCGGGPENYLRVNITDSVYSRIILFDANDGYSLYVKVIIPEGNSLQFESNDFTLISDQGNSSVKMESIYMPPRISKEVINPTDVLLGKSYPDRKQYKSTLDFNFEQYMIHVPVIPAAIKSERITIKYPKIKVNGKLTTIPPIRYERKSGTFSVALNC